MKKIIFCMLGAAAGICLAIVVHCSFMITEMYDSSMFPAIEPGQKVLVFMPAGIDDIEPGDIVAYESPYHQIDGGRRVSVRRVENIGDGKVVLICDAGIDDKDRTVIRTDDILGKVLTF